jgi:hypothetical protein
MLPHLAWAMQERGTHSWGASDGYETVKYLGAICFTWIEEEERIAGWDRGIFHTRAASVGAHDTIENAHPFSFRRERDGAQIIGIHNGTLGNWQELNSRFERHFTVDSMHLWKHRAEDLPWTDLRGVANLAWWETSPEGVRTLLAARINANSLAIGVTGDGGVVFCSTKEALQKAAWFAGTQLATSYTVDEGVVYRLGQDALYDTTERVQFGSYPTHSAAQQFGFQGGTPVQPPFGSGHGGGGGGWTPGTTYETCRGEHWQGWTVGECYQCNSSVESGGDILCPTCLHKSVSEFLVVSRVGERKRWEREREGGGDITTKTQAQSQLGASLSEAQGGAE